MSANNNFALSQEAKFLPLLFGVPLFIFCGFPHCVADAFHYLTAPLDFLIDNLGKVVLLYVGIVAGNFVGCNLYRFVIDNNDLLEYCRPKT